ALACRQLGGVTGGVPPNAPPLSGHDPAWVRVRHDAVRRGSLSRARPLRCEDGGHGPPLDALRARPRRWDARRLLGVVLRAARALPERLQREHLLLGAAHLPLPRSHLVSDGAARREDAPRRGPPSAPRRRLAARDARRDDAVPRREPPPGRRGDAAGP